MVTLNTEALSELGKSIDEKLAKCGINDRATLEINVSSEDFRKIDEDIFYTFVKQGMYENLDVDFVPSKEKISVTFNKCDIVIREK